MVYTSGTTDGRRVKPMVFASLPLFLEKIHARIVADGSTRVADKFASACVYLLQAAHRCRFEVAGFFAAAGLPILQAYGLTENVCVAFNRPDNYKFGTGGPPMPGCEVRIADDKEILVRSETMYRRLLQGS
jgi:long-chain acyl-CoA synthetase